MIELCILKKQVASNKKLMEEMPLTFQDKINVNQLKAKNIFSRKEKFQSQLNDSPRRKHVTFECYQKI